MTGFAAALDDAALDYLEEHETSFEFRDGAEWAREYQMAWLTERMDPRHKHLPEWIECFAWVLANLEDAPSRIRPT